MALDTMRRYLTPDEDTSLEGVDAKTPEEAEAELAGVSVSDWRDLAKPEKGPMAALERATFTARNPVGPPTAEESDARLAGMSLSQWRDLAKPEKGPMAALDRATFAARNPVGPPAPESTLIPIRTAPSGSDAAKATASTLPTVTADKPAGTPDSSGKDGMPAPSSEGAGGDTSERDLYLARLAAQSAAGFGGMGAGKNIDMGIADTLGERLKQVQALRAKREERSMELAREDEQSSALVQQYKSLASQGLVPELPALDRLPPKQAASLIKTYGSLPGMVAKATDTAAMTPVKVEAGLAGAEGKRAQAKSRTYTDALTQAKTENEIARKGVIAAQALALQARSELDRAKASGAPEGDSRLVNARQKLVDAYQKQYLAPAESLAAVEAKAPGLTRGQSPEWLTGRELELVRNNATYELASDETKDVFAAAQKYLDGYRKQQYGSALTATEQAELERLVKADIFTGADKLSRFFDLIRRDIANNFQSKLKGDRLVQQSFVDKYVGAEEGPLAKFVGPQGLFSDVWTLPKTSTTGERPPTPSLTKGKTALWDVANNKWVSAPDDQVDAAVASGKYSR